jgi:RAQPRD family integrative conjugative element protein
MTQRAGARTHRPPCRVARVVVLAVTAALALAPTYAADSAAETERLAALLRQLDALERIVESRAPSESLSRSRYYFDYARLQADLARIRAGIDDYLHPARAQPRDPDQLIGEYRLTNAAP